MTTMTYEEEETMVVSLLARAFYLDYCETLNKKAYAPPYVPTWALSYARIAVSTCGYDEQAVEELRKATA